MNAHAICLVIALVLAFIAAFVGMFARADSPLGRVSFFAASFFFYLLSQLFS